MRKQLLVLSLLFLCTIVNAQSRIYVDRDNNSAIVNGVTWASAFDSLHHALGAASSGDTILVAEGVYKPHPTDRDSSFIITEGIAMLGGFDPSLGITDISQRDWIQYKSILSGNIGIISDSTDNSYNVVFIQPGIINMTLIDGFIIKEGQADGPSSPNKDGAGVKAGGGAIIRNCKIINNHSEDQGGGIDLDNDVDIIDCSFVKNSAGIGSAINSNDWVGTLSGTSFWENFALDTLVETIRLTFPNCIIENIDIDNNIGVGIKQFGGSFTLNNSYIRNYIGISETAISTNNEGSVHLNNCQISYNKSVNGRGSWYIGTNSVATSLNTTIAYNEATSLTAGIALAGHLTSTNLIVTNNQVPLDPSTSNFIKYVGGQHFVKNSLMRKSGGSSNWLVGNGTDNGNNIDADPLFIDTITLALSGCSPTKDVGFDTTALLNFDISGLTRIMGPEVDMGAHEYIPGSDNEEGCISFTQKSYVDTDAVGLNNGTTWNDAYNELFDAINSAVEGDTIMVAEGIYHPSVTDRDSSFFISKQIVLLGGFDPGAGVYSLGNRDWESYSCILSGDIGPSADTIGNNFLVMKISGIDIDSTTIVDGFTIEEGVGSFGSGLEVLLCSPSIRNMKIRNNYNSAVKLHSTSSKLENCDIRFNENGAGAGLYIYDSDVEIISCQIINNTTTSFGGGLYIRESIVKLVHTLIYNNTANESGGAHIFDSDVTMDACFISENSAATTGGITVYVSEVNLSNSILSRNTSTYDGAGAASVFSAGVLNNYNTTIAYNSGIETGGIRFTSNGGSIQNTNSIIYGNDIAGNTTSIPSQMVLYSTVSQENVKNKHSLIGNSGGSTSWNTLLGIDLGGNLDVVQIIMTSFY